MPSDLTRPIIGIENRAAQEVFDIMCDRFRAAERALAERAGGVKGEWHRVDGDKSILLYTLRQDGWRKGEAVMVNDVTVRIEAANGSEAPIEPIASAILSALTTEPAAPFVDHPRETNDVVSHETPNPEDKPAAPEGRQEAVTPRSLSMKDGVITAAYDSDEDAQAVYDLIESGFTRPAEQAVTEDWREIKQHVQPRIADGYTAVAISKPGYWFVKGPGPAAAAIRALGRKA